MSGEAFWQGYDARLKGAELGACPYPPGTAKAAEWREGWEDKFVAFMVEESEIAQNLDPKVSARG